MYPPLGTTQRMRWLDLITNSMDMDLSKLRRWWKTEVSGGLQSMGLERIRCDLATEQQQKVASLPEKSSVFHLFIPPSPQLLTTIDLFTVSRVLPFPECHGVPTPFGFEFSVSDFFPSLRGELGRRAWSKGNCGCSHFQELGTIGDQPSPDSRRLWVKQGE